MYEFRQNDFAVRCIMCGVSGLDPTTYADAAAFAADNAAITTVSEDQETISAIASCEGAMNAIAEDRSALTTIAASQTATDEVYENTVSINALNNSSLVETTVYEGGECAGAGHNYRNDRVVLLSHNSAQFAADLANTSEFGRSAGDQPQTANQVAQNTNVNDGRNAANAQITFIDV